MVMLSRPARAVYVSACCDNLLCALEKPCDCERYGERCLTVFGKD